ncbi:hypothetical protein MCC10112_1455 [Bifidobacterium longum subsp. longum]|nr:hypothetical protein MCC10097_1467 [Bifidobacterium longum subsp. longum]TCF55876.1 hypothetical protein MCC10112_1455 [Bifidobacterium longum subsp. longum]
MLIPSSPLIVRFPYSSLSRRVNANSQPEEEPDQQAAKLIKKGEC